MAHIIVVVELATVVTIADKVEQLVAVASCIPKPFPTFKTRSGRIWEWETPQFPTHWEPKRWPQ